MSDPLHERGSAMEDLFFAQQDEKLLDKLRAELSAKESRAALESASGIHDASVLDALTGSGITPETLTSVALIPLVAVAWSDDRIDKSERTAILKAAEVAGISTDSASYATLESWLLTKPTPELLATWKSYVRSLKSTIDGPSFNQLKNSVLDRAKAVAKSAGGFLGLGDKVSASERKVLDDLAKAFE